MNVRTFEAITPDSKTVTVSTFCDASAERWETLTYLASIYPQLDRWCYLGDSEYMPHDYMMERKG